MADALDAAAEHTEDRSPFTPGFGKPPLELVGRADIVSDIDAGFRLGPQDSRFVTVMMGPRGCGKTTVLNEADDLAAARGWPVISVDASTPGLATRIKAQIQAIRDTYGIIGDAIPDAVRGAKEITRGFDIKLARFASAQMKEVNLDWDVRRLLTTLGERAAESGIAVLLSVDELHAADREELRRLAADLQHVTHRGQLPVAFIGGALTELSDIIARDNKLSFFTRCDQPDIPAISAEESAAFFKTSVAAYGGSIDDDATARLAAGCDGYPYKMQLLGDAAWRRSGSPHGHISREIAVSAAELAERVMRRNVYEPTWIGMTRRDRICLSRIAFLGESATTDSLFEDIGDSADEDRSDLIRRLARAGLIAHDPDSGHLRCGPMMPPEVVTELGSLDYGPQAIQRPDAANRAPQAICGRPMKRVAGRCVLPAGHTGRCRSKKPKQ